MINPTLKWSFVAGALVLGLVAGAGGMRVWDKGEIAALNLSLAQTKQKQAEDVSKASQAALADLTAATAKIKAAAEGGQTSYIALNSKLDAIDRRIKNAKPAPLPVDCKPGVDRVRNLAESAAAVDQAIARPVSSK